MNENLKKIAMGLAPGVIGGILEIVIKRLFDTVDWLWVVVGVAISIFVFIVYVLPDFLHSFDDGRRTGIMLLSLSSFFIGGFMIWEQVLGPQFSEQLIDQGQVQILIHSQRWITYDPLQFNPYTYTMPDKQSMDQEMRWLKDAGFTGIITFSSTDNFALIPEIAKKYDLKVIMGIWNPADEKEVKQAISAKEFVDAYSVGHDGLGTRYSFEQLIHTIQYVRFHTQIPVSTTEKIGQYISDPRLLEIGDWVFPDTHVAVQQKDAAGSSQYYANAIRDSLETISMAKTIDDMKERKGKPILLKMVTYPMAGVSNASFAEQTKFFIAILDGRRNVIPDMPLDVSISVHSVFDSPWKTTWPFYEWDAYTGLFDSTGIPRPAVSEIIQRLP